MSGTISKISINGFRNLCVEALDLSPNINLIYGNNGSGKTSFLEAIYYLGLGRSFRTSLGKRLIAHDKNQFILFAELADIHSLETTIIGIDRTTSSQQNIRINGRNATSIREVASLLPIQLIDDQSHLLISSGPAARRQYLDWGAFHLYPEFFVQWQRCQKILKQRNAELRNKPAYAQIKHWDEEFSIIAANLTELRIDYIKKLEPIFFTLLEKLLANVNLQWTFHSGWPKEQPLKDLLHASFFRDLQMGFTTQGPHRADLAFTCQANPAHEVLSQGQQKLLAYTLRLAQGHLLEKECGKTCIYLIDDLPAELDPHKRECISEILLAMKAQLLITGIEPAMLAAFSGTNSRMFHVEHGVICRP